MAIRETLKRIYRITMIGVTVVFGIATAAAYFSATSGNGLLLVAMIMAVLTLMAGLSIFKLDWQDEEAKAYRGIAQDLITRFGRPQLSDGIGAIARPGTGGDSRFQFTFQVAEPEVHRVDAAGLDDAKRMAAAGAPIDDICRSIDPDHEGHDAAHQEAFRKIVRAMIEQS